MTKQTYKKKIQLNKLFVRYFIFNRYLRFYRKLVIKIITYSTLFKSFNNR